MPVIRVVLVVAALPLLLSVARCGHRKVPPVLRSGEVRPVTYGTSDAKYPANNNYYRVKEEYGARGDGTTDDTVAIQKAIDDALRSKKVNIDGGRYGTIYFTPGTYKISDTLFWATFGDGKAKVSSTVDASRGCITSLKVDAAGSGYGSSNTGNNPNGGPLLYFSGGGGYGPSIYGNRTSSGGITTPFNTALGNIGSMGCLGKGYKTPPEIRVLNWRAYLRFEGQSKNDTIIKLSDNNPKFQNANCKISPWGDPDLLEPCRPMILVANEGAGNSQGMGESAYADDVWNLTISTGTGNPGAIALDWQDSNSASAKNLILKSEDGKAKCGLSLSRSKDAGTGPGYVKNVQINGFEYGIYANEAAHEVGNTFEFIDLLNISKAGVVNGGMPNWFRAITMTHSSAPAFINQGDGGSLLVVDATFDGSGAPIPGCPCSSGGATVPAIQNKASHGVLYLRNINTAGYPSALEGVSGSYIDEYSYPQSISDQRLSLNLGPVPNTPEHWRYPDKNPEDWANIADYGSACGINTGQDASDCIQKAIDAARDIVYVPYGRYRIGKTIHIRGNTRVFYGDSAYFYNNPSKAFCTISIEDSNTSWTDIEVRNIRFQQSSQSNSFCVSAQNKKVTIANSLHGINLTWNTPNSSMDGFIEDLAIPSATFTLGPNQHIWARQWDIESGTGQHTYQTGGIFWTLGYKTEGAGCLWKTTNGTTEILGSFSSSAGSPAPCPAYEAKNSKTSAHAMTMKNGWSVGFRDDGADTKPNTMWTGSGNGTGALRSKRAQ
jgi:hypothetical protein